MKRDKQIFKSSSVTVNLRERDYRGFIALIFVGTYASLLILGNMVEAAALGPWVGLIVERYFEVRRRLRV